MRRDLASHRRDIGAALLAVGASLLSLVGVVIAGTIVGRRAKLSPIGSLNTSFTLLARGEFSIIIVNLALAGALMPVLQPFAALYVLILASASPLLAKESERIYGLFERLVTRLRRKKKADEADEEDEAVEGDEAVEENEAVEEDEAVEGDEAVEEAEV